MQCNVMRWNIMECECNATKFNAMEWNVTQGNGMKFSGMPWNVLQCNVTKSCKKGSGRVAFDHCYFWTRFWLPNGCNPSKRSLPTYFRGSPCRRVPCANCSVHSSPRGHCSLSGTCYWYPASVSGSAEHSLYAGSGWLSRYGAGPLTQRS
jgi:hypothetical protein